MARRLGFVEPMKATTTSAPPYDGNWLYEVKLDGYRVLAVKNGKAVQLWSRNKKRLDERFPEVAAAVAKLPVTHCILDGEVCALDGKGHSSFQLLQNSEEGVHPIVYYVFDVLFAGGKDLRRLPLMRRKTHLDAILLNAKDPLRPSIFFTEDPATVLRKMREVGAEGAIAKRRDSTYDGGSRSSAWVKIKWRRSQELVIVGYTLPEKSRQYFGSLALGYYEGKKLIFAGRVGTGYTAKTLKEIYGKLRKIEVAEPPVERIKPPSGRWRGPDWRPATTRWVQPRLVGQFEFAEWTSDGVLRQGSFVGLRDDKDPRKVVREPPLGK